MFIGEAEATHRVKWRRSVHRRGRGWQISSLWMLSLLNVVVESSSWYFYDSLLTIIHFGKTLWGVKTSNRLVEPNPPYWDANQRMIESHDLIVSQPTKEMHFLVMWMFACNIGVFRNSFWWVIPPSRVIEETATIKWTEPITALPCKGFLLWWQPDILEAIYNTLIHYLVKK